MNLFESCSTTSTCAGQKRCLKCYAARKLTNYRVAMTSRCNPLSNMSAEESSFDKPGPDASEEEKTAHASKQAAKFSKDMESRDPKDDLAQQLTEIEFKICISACTIARYLSEHADAMPLNVVSRITDTHDYLVLILPLIENPPWTRRTEAGKWEKLEDYKWTEVAPIDLLKITKLEGQPWIALYNLVAKKSSVSDITLTTSVKDSF